MVTRMPELVLISYYESVVNLISSSSQQQMMKPCMVIGAPEAVHKENGNAGHPCLFRRNISVSICYSILQYTPPSSNHYVAKGSIIHPAVLSYWVETLPTCL